MSYNTLSYLVKLLLLLLGNFLQLSTLLLQNFISLLLKRFDLFLEQLDHHGSVLRCVVLASDRHPLEIDAYVLVLHCYVQLFEKFIVCCLHHVNLLLKTFDLLLLATELLLLRSCLKLEPFHNSQQLFIFNLSFS